MRHFFAREKYGKKFHLVGVGDVVIEKEEK